MLVCNISTIIYAEVNGRFKYFAKNFGHNGLGVIFTEIFSRIPFKVPCGQNVRCLWKTGSTLLPPRLCQRRYYDVGHQTVLFANGIRGGSRRSLAEGHNLSQTPPPKKQNLDRMQF